jgi:hypothetical protein
MYRQFIHSVAFVNYKSCTCLRPLYLYFPDTPHIQQALIQFHSVICSKSLKFISFIQITMYIIKL